MEEVGQSVVNIWRQLRLRESPFKTFFSKRVYRQQKINVTGTYQDPQNTGPGFLVNPDPDPGLGFSAQKLKSSFIKILKKTKQFLTFALPENGFLNSRSYHNLGQQYGIRNNLSRIQGLKSNLITNEDLQHRSSIKKYRFDYQDLKQSEQVRNL